MKVVVVGAGVLGASAAYHLLRGGAQVALVDAAHEGRATAAGAGIISPWAAQETDGDWYRLASGGARLYPSLIRALAEDGETDTGYRQVGSLMVSTDAGELDATERRVRANRRDAPEAGEVSRFAPAEARRLFPPLHPDLAAVHISGGARVDGRRFSAALLRAAISRGADHHEGHATLMMQGDRVRGIGIDGQRIDADAVVLATGAWGAELLRPLGLCLAVAPQRGQIVHLHLPATETRHWAMALPLSDHYLLAFDDSRVVVGATRETGSGFDYRVTAAGLAQVLRNALGIAPGLAEASVLETRIGFRPVAADGIPLLGAASGVPGLFIGNGLGPSGLTIGPYAGRLLAELVLHGKASIDLSPYDPLR